MKRILFICCALFLGTTFITAQSTTDKEQKRADRTERLQDRDEQVENRATEALERLTKSLDLTEGQVMKIKSFQASNAAARKAEMEGATTREEHKTIGKKYLTLADEQITSVLTAEQQKKFTEQKARRVENAEARKGKRGNREGARRPRPEDAPEGTGGGF